MADYLDEFASTQNLLRMAQPGQFPAPSSNAPTPYESQPIEQYLPPAIPHNNVVALIPHPTAVNTNPQPEPTDSDPQNLLQELTSIIRDKESNDNYQAINKERPGNTASGAYQYTDSTWNNFMGYPKAALAPKAVQDKRFAMDIAKRYAKFNGNPYQVIAAHYLPALADEPSKWFTPFKVHGRVVKPVIDYVRYVVKDTPLEKGLHEYLAQQ